MEKNKILTNKSIIISNIKAIGRDLFIGIILYFFIHFVFNKYEQSLLDFLKKQAISILGVMLPINIAGLGQAHISMNGIEERKNKKIEIFEKVRLDLRLTLTFSIFAFLISVISCIIIGTKDVSYNINTLFTILYISCFVFSLQCLYETYCKGIFEIPAILNSNPIQQN